MKGISIEFIGFPGSGKSTVANQLAKHLREAEYRVVDINIRNKLIKDMEKKQKYLCRFLALMNMLKVFDILIYSLINEKISHSNLMTWWKCICIKKSYHKYLLNKLSCTDYFIFDEYSYHNIFCLLAFQRKIKYSHIQRIIRLMSNSDVLVLGEISDNVLTDRLSNRISGSRFDGHDLTKTNEIIREKMYIYNKVIKLAEKSKSKKIIINFEDDSIYNSEIIFNFLLNS